MSQKTIVTVNGVESDIFSTKKEARVYGKRMIREFIKDSKGLGGIDIQYIQVKKNVLNCLEKKFYFIFEGKEYVIDLTEGDLGSSWNHITLPNGNEMNFEFHWDEEEVNYEPTVTLYRLYKNAEGEWNQDHVLEEIDIEVDKIIGSYKTYFNIE